MAEGGRLARSRRLEPTLFAAASLLLMGLGGTGAYVAGWLPMGPGATAVLAADDGTSPGGRPGEDAGRATVVVDMPDLLVNLRGDGPHMRFLKMRIALEVASDSDAERVRRLQARIMDGFQLHLRTLEVDELTGATAMARLKEHLLRRSNHAVAPVRVRDVLFEEILVQ